MGSRTRASVVAAHRFSYSEARGIFLDQGSNWCPLHWQADSQPLNHQGSPQQQSLKIKLLLYFLLCVHFFFHKKRFLYILNTLTGILFLMWTKKVQNAENELSRQISISISKYLFYLEIIKIFSLMNSLHFSKRNGLLVGKFDKVSL